MECTTADRHREFVRLLQNRGTCCSTKGTRTVHSCNTAEDQEPEDLDDALQRLFDELFEDGE